MTIAQVTDRFEIGGGLEHIFQIAKGMPEHSFVIFGKGGKQTEKFTCLPNVSLSQNGYSPTAIESFPVEIIHIHHTRPMLTLLSRRNSLPNIPIIVTAHGLHIRQYFFRHTPWSNMLYYLRLNLEKFLYNKADVVIAVSREDQQFIRNKYGRKDCLYIPNGISATPSRLISAQRDQLRRELGIPPDKFLCLTIARFDFPKGYDVLVDAIALLKSQNALHNLHFLFVGDGKLKAPIYRKIQRLGLESVVCLPGRREDISNLLNLADLFILPSRWEGLPLTLLEAGAQKTPVLASDTWGIREIVQHEETGLLFPVESSRGLAKVLSEILKNNYDLPTLSENLYALVTQKYSYVNMIKRLKSVYSLRGNN